MVPCTAVVPDVGCLADSVEVLKDGAEAAELYLAPFCLADAKLRLKDAENQASVIPLRRCLAGGFWNPSQWPGGESEPHMFLSQLLV